MSTFVRQHKGAVLLSAVLHIAVVAALAAGVRLPERERAPIATQLAIEAVVVDQAVLNREIERRERAERQEAQRKQREERQAREAVENERRQREEAVRKEQARLAEIQLQRERAETAERERAESAKREQERVAEERRQTEQRQQREREEAAKREREAAAAARRQAETEAELQRSLAAENERRAAEEAGLLEQYARMIENQIERNWIPPPGAPAGLDCMVRVVQIPSGDVIDVRVGQCNGDDAVVRSIEAAVRRASPLPKPPNMSVFDRNLNVRFRPDL